MSQTRHSVASIDGLKTSRSLAEVQQTGFWQCRASANRYEKFQSGKRWSESTSESPTQIRGQRYPCRGVRIGQDVSSATHSRLHRQFFVGCVVERRRLLGVPVNVAFSRMFSTSLTVNNTICTTTAGWLFKLARALQHHESCWPNSLAASAH